MLLQIQKIVMQPIRTQTGTVNYHGKVLGSYNRVHTDQFPLVSSRPHSSITDITTIDDIISDVSPELTMKPIQIRELTLRNVKRLSDYDNMEEYLARQPQECVGTPVRTDVSSAGTCYCSPWDSSLWDDIINLGTTSHQQGKQRQKSNTIS